MRQDSWLHIIAHILDYTFIFTCVWCYSLFEHQTISQGQLSLDMRATAVLQKGSSSSLANGRYCCVHALGFESSALSRCRGCYGYVTALVYVQLWDNAGRIVLWYTAHYRFKLRVKFTQIPLKRRSRFHPKLAFPVCSVRLTGLGQCSSEKTRLPSPTPPSPLLGANPFVALAPLLRLWSWHLKSHLH